ncbi:MAG: hypothetical protein JXQ73_28790 [Phycisphaerae bacterium]|nr:hypothetical protein [Phycisphaerae bacterium]
MRFMMSGSTVILAAVCASTGSAPAAITAPRQLGDLTGPWQLFVDDGIVAEKTDLTRVYHAFDKHPANPVLKADKPWEGTTAYVYGTVLPADSGAGYRMWYHSWAGEYRILYATSDDGIRWHKPDLGFVDYKGSKNSNILFRRTREDHTPQVIHTPWETDPTRRYKLINFDYGRTPPDHTISGYWGATSPDGIRWTTLPHNPILRDPGDVGNFVWDPHTKRYIGYPKKFTTVRGHRRRCTGFTETTRFEAWPETTMVLIPDPYDDRWVKTAGQHTDFYGLSAFAYESMYIGFLWIFRITDGKNDGPIFVELVSSRDGINWVRQEPPRAPILPTGPNGAWDDGMIFTTNHPLVEGDTIKLWYGGFDVGHGAGKATASVGLATLRKDGFASLDAGDTPGTVTTHELTGARGILRANYKANDGWLKAEVLDESGKVVPGYSRDDSTPLTGDSVDHPVAWKAHKTLPETQTRIRLRFVLKNASIYSFAAGDGVKPLIPDGGILYTFEGDTAPTVKDTWTSDGPQNGTLHNDVSLSADKADAAFGTGSARFKGGDTAWDTIEIPATTQLGSTFTLAAHVDYENKGLTRLFTSYRGGGPALDTELIFDFDPSGKQVNGLRAVLKAQTIESDVDQLPTDGKYHHFAMTYDNGNVALYFDGKEVGRGEVDPGLVLLADNLRFGEDLGGGANEQLRGYADDVLVLRRALTPAEVSTLAAKGAAALPKRPPQPTPQRPLMANVEQQTRNIGSRLELFVDDYLIDSLKDAKLKLHHPTPAEIAVKFDKPWENVHAGYCTVIKDGDKYKLYYRGMPPAGDGSAAECTCYAESNDGIHWTKPNLGLYERNGTKDNNVILAEMPPLSHNFSPFLDTKPGVPPAQRYKALAGLDKSGLVAFVSPDGIHWTKLSDKPVITKGAFDSQNVAFWSEYEQRYVCYFRTWSGVRWISRATSKDFIHWTSPRAMKAGDTPPEHLYTNQTAPYFRAPHIYIATAARFMQARRVLTDAQLTQLGIDLKYWLKDDTSEVVLLSSRGGLDYARTFMEAFVRPGIGLRNWVSRGNYPALGVVPTGPAEMSMYVRRHNGQPSHHLLRYTMRTDGFVSVNAPYAGGELLTKPLTFQGKQLVINYATSAPGYVKVEIQTEAGKPIPGHTLAEATEIIGDEIERVVSWKTGPDLAKLAGTPVRLRFVMKDADLYSIRFR